MCQPMSGCHESENCLGGTHSCTLTPSGQAWVRPRCPRPWYPHSHSQNLFQNYHNFTYCFCHQISHLKSCPIECMQIMFYIVFPPLSFIQLIYIYCLDSIFLLWANRNCDDDLMKWSLISVPQGLICVFITNKDSIFLSHELHLSSIQQLLFILRQQIGIICITL